MKEMIQNLKATIEDQIKHGPSEHAMYRMKHLVEIIENEMEPDELFDSAHEEFYENPRKRNFTPGTQQFNMYVYQKVNSPKDVRNIANRYDITEVEVMEAYKAGQDIYL